MNRSPRLSHVVVAALGGAAAFSSTVSSLAMDMKGMEAPAASTPGKQSSEPVIGSGVVKSIDKAQGTVTLAHDPIKSINWPSMTMAFKVRNKASLDSVKTGARVDFTLEKVGNDYVVTAMKQ
jgi:Cu(I)/Ag(I) efflux system protein CusF